jgi:hypothetical protein
MPDRPGRHDALALGGMVMDEFRGIANVIESTWRPAGQIWPWIVAVIGVLIIAAGAMLFTP